ncbi:MAG: histidine kinase [Flavobacteriales bacterium]|nr:histidine kinase [Flavobacteriales bacterium]
MNKLFLLSFFLLSTFVSAQELSYKLLNKANGLSSNTALTLCEDKQGYLWIGTTFGLNKYDGNSIIHYNKSDGLNSNYISYVFSDKNNNLWVGTLKGVNRIKNGLIEKIHIQENSEYSNEVTAINQFRGEIILGTEDGLYSLGKDEFTKGNITTSVQSITITDSTLWVATHDGLYEINTDTNFYPEYLGNCKVLKNDTATFLFADNDLINLKDKSKINLPFKSSIKDIVIQNGKIVLGSYGDGIWLLDEDGITQITGKGEYFDRTIQQVILTHDNELWIASNAGITHIEKSAFKPYYKENTKGIFPILWENNQLFFGGANGISTLKNETIIKHSISENPREKFILSIGTNELDEICATGIGGEIFKFKNEEFTKIKNLPEVLTESYIYDICANDTATFYAASTNLFYSKADDFYRLKINPIGSVNYDILNTKSGLWLASSKGLIFWNGKDTVLYNDKQGMPNHSLKVLEEDGFGNIWIGTSSHGLIKFDGNNFTHYYYEITNPEIKSLQWDKYRNCLWAGTNEGLNKLYFDSLGTYISTEHFSDMNGYPIDFCHNKSLELLPDSSLLIAFNIIGTEKDYIHRYKGEKTKENIEIPSVIITGVSVNNIKRLKAELNLNHKENDVSIDFTAVHLLRGKYFEFQWRLNNEKWSESTTQRNVYFHNLATGKYNFQIRTKLPNQEWSTVNETRFTIHPPFWKTWWFILLIIIAFTFTIIWLVKRKIKNSLQQEQRNLSYLKKQAELELKAVRAQLNPHFLFNVLNSIQDLLLDNDEENARIYLSDCSQLMRLVLDYSSKDSITLAKELELLKKYLKLEKLRFGNELNIEWNIKANLEENYVPPLILQPYVENAIKHGIETKGKISIEIFEDKNTITCIIQDDGIGFQNENPLHESKGLKLMQERLDSLNQLANSNKNSQEIINLDKGTKVILKLSKI